MYYVEGKYNKAAIYSLSCDSETYAQVLRMCNMEELADSRICMMPDMHASDGCTVGTSMTVGEKINPSFVGGDIGCGMQVYKLKESEMDFNVLDSVISVKIPSGAAIHAHGNSAINKVPLKDLHCYDEISHEIVSRSIGTLGGGNHFVEVDRDSCGKLYLVVHSGSRRLGRDVALFYQKVALMLGCGMNVGESLKKGVKLSDIKTTLRKEDCFLYGIYREKYLHDMDIAVKYAAENRRWIAETIISSLGLTVEEEFATVHNYIDTKAGVLRKGAVSAASGERLIIPINMADGSFICTGKGNPDWNYTAPHGAGRIIKRSEARDKISLEAYKDIMKGVYTTSVSDSTIDESPFAYRRSEEIMDAIGDTAEINDILSPVYNFKASKAVVDDETADGKD